MQKVLVLFFVIVLAIAGCENKVPENIETPDWSARRASGSKMDSLENGKSYLSIYSQIYTLDEKRKSNLTAMTSLRNTSISDTIYISKVDYYDTHGALIRQYIKQPIYLVPLETVEIVIEEMDDKGGTGSNFIFEWMKPKGSPEPLFEGVMNSTLGQQGLSFTTTSRRIE